MTKATVSTKKNLQTPAIAISADDPLAAVFGLAKTGRNAFTVVELQIRAEKVIKTHVIFTEEPRLHAIDNLKVTLGRWIFGGEEGAQPRSSAQLPECTDTITAFGIAKVREGWVAVQVDVDDGIVVDSQTLGEPGPRKLASNACCDALNSHFFGLT